MNAYTFDFAEDSLAVANEFIRQSVARRIPPTPMKLQKLIYFAHGWNLALVDRPLVEEIFQAWQYGPVLPTVYHEFKYFGKNPVTHMASRWCVIDGKTQEVDVPLSIEGEEHVIGLVSRILDVYGAWTGGQLSAATHVEGGPWWKACGGNADRGRFIPIDNEEIMRFFKDKLESVA